MGFLQKLIDRLPWVKERKEFERRIENTERRIFVLPIQSARVEVQRLLTDKREYRCVEAPPSTELAQTRQSFPPSLRKFFERFECVEALHGETRLSSALIGPASNEPGLTRIGEDVEFSEIAAVPGSEEVLLRWGEAPGDEPPERYPSVYHLLLMNAAIQERYSPP